MGFRAVVNESAAILGKLRKECPMFRGMQGTDSCTQITSHRSRHDMVNKKIMKDANVLSKFRQLRFLN